MWKLKKIVRKVVPSSLVRILEKAYRQSRGLLWQIRYGFPARGMRVIAVTGTNGKTTTCAYINEVLKSAGFKTAVLTTVFYEFGGKKIPNKTHFTVHKQSIVQDFFAKAKKSGADWAVIEVTSQALDQDRIMGVPVEIAVITNLTQEHLDYHKTMKNYARAKARLLKDYGTKFAVLNRDDKWFEFFKESSKAQVFSYGKLTGADAQIKSIKVTREGTEANIACDGQKLLLKTSLLGEFNVYNAAVAVGVGQILDIKYKKIIQGISNLKQIDGRMEEIKCGQDFQVFVDFAITPDAIKSVLESLQKTSKGKVRIVFGATGDRDKEKRPQMGEVAAKYADMIYLTDDETYTEDPKSIRDAVYRGIEAAKSTNKTKVIADRKEAIAQALKDSKKGDVVLITGLGHEDSRNMGGKLVPWRDQEVAQKVLQSVLD